MAKRNDKCSLLLILASAAVIVLLAAQVKPAVASVYTSAMETAVRGVVKNNKAVAPGLVRLLFHDAFVRGSDGSVLLLSTPTNTAGQTEQASPRNGGLRGLNLIQEIRDAIFKAAGENVSCADAVVFAAREATFVLSNEAIAYDIAGPGRLDGVNSSSAEPENFLPGSTFNFTQLLASFVAKGLGVTELVALSGAHSIGVTHRASFADRLTSDIVARDQINRDYQSVIKKESGSGAGASANPTATFLNNIRDMGATAVRKSGYNDTKVNLAAVGVLDNSFYNANLQNMVRFKSDWELRTNDVAANLMQTYKVDFASWKNDFRAAMTRLSNELTSQGPQFEVGIRKDCTRTNLNSYPPPAPAPAP
ncbi:unnamed protein product [Alopecurus aequalis]